MNNFTQTMIKAREEYISKIKDELLGPGTGICIPDKEHELISESADSRYSVGILFPKNTKIESENDDTINTDNESNSDEDTDLKEESELSEKSIPDTDKSAIENYEGEETAEQRESVNLYGQNKPSSFGITFFIKGNADKINCSVKFATYRKAVSSDCRYPFAADDNSEFNVSTTLKQYVKYDMEEKTLKFIDSGVDYKKLKSLSERADSFTEYENNVVKAMYRLNEQKSRGYVREPHSSDIIIKFLDENYTEDNKHIDGTDLNITALRRKISDDIYSVTIMGVNDSEEVKNKEKLICQPEIIVKSDNNAFVFSDYSSSISYDLLSDEDKSLELQYRNKKVYATGLGASANWKIDNSGKGYICTDYFPHIENADMNYQLPDNYGIDERASSMKFLSDLDDTDKSEKIKALKTIIDAYEKWIDNTCETIKNFGEDERKYTAVAEKNMKECRESCRRMMSGLKTLEENSTVWDAFTLANRAMFIQRVQLQIQRSTIANDETNLAQILSETDYYLCEPEHNWRGFQIAFILMSIDSVTNDQSPDKEIADLIWFPTGGGKTEAYLGLTAITIFYRKLAYPKNAAGTAVIMRYTLRLLTSQQFIRAATLICACEFIRRDSSGPVKKFGAKKHVSKYKSYPLGDDEINIGLWLGEKHTPNKIKDAVECCNELLSIVSENDFYNKFHKNAKFQLLKCPWCGTSLIKSISNKKLSGSWGYRTRNKSNFEFFCPQEKCKFNSKLPVYVVDSQLYDSPPTLLFGTVDKFAMLPWIGEAGRFFGVTSDNRAPELIIQDELHLISGPLGSMVGLYETAIDALCQEKGIKTKIIASTATIRHAKEQCISLYNRTVNQFPNPAIDSADSFFAREKEVDYSTGNYGRMYVGLMPSAKTKATMEVQSIASLLQYAHELEYDNDVKDKFWTLPVYFGSLKELGKCQTLVEDDVVDAIRRKAERNGTSIRYTGQPDELTSRISTTTLTKTLDKLEYNTYTGANIEWEKKPSDVLLCTNMISVGIDIARLSSMIIIGQPKLTSEYIQASSRIGRAYPGVCFTMYDASRSRDRSHYEQFKSYHSSFYKFVEPTGVTPFSDPARARALHSIAVSLMRNKSSDISDEISASGFSKNKYSTEIEQMKKFIIERAERINREVFPDRDSDSEMIESELDEILNRWEKEASCYEKDKFVYGYRFIMGDNLPEKNQGRLLRPFNAPHSSNDDSFETMTSMRSVDVSIRGELKKQADSTPKDLYSQFSVRGAQTVYQYGPGAIVDMPDVSFMTVSPALWKTDSTVPVHDERLQKLLNVKEFRKFNGDKGKKITYTRFPEWYFCTRCRTFKPLSEWERTDDDSVVPRCCKMKTVVSRIITICENGHIDDFPWIEWVHAKSHPSKPLCGNPSLKLYSGSGTTEGLEGIRVTCTSCKATATLKGSFGPNALERVDEKTGHTYNFRCKGKHPWNFTKEKCTCYPRVTQRGSSSVYYPFTESSIVIPPYSSEMYKLIYNDENYEKCSDKIAGINEMAESFGLEREQVNIKIKDAIRDFSEKISLNKNIPVDNVVKVLTQSYLDADETIGYSTSSVMYRHQEFCALNGEADIKDSDGDFKRESTDITQYNIPYVKNVSLINRLREVRVLLGFSRVNPGERDDKTGEYSNVVSILNEKDNWYPAYEAFGEGIFVEFDNDKLDEWVSSNIRISERVDILNRNYANSFFGKKKKRKINAKFLFLHTLSHMLIRQLSYDCGYSVASLKERLYCSNEADGVIMNGILIYTAGGDSEGTLGGLVRQGRSDVFPEIFRKAIESSMICSNDPVCSISTGQGRDGLNLAACHSCSLLPETVCEEYNSFLDRSFITGNFDNTGTGLYSAHMKDPEIWKDFFVLKNVETNKKEKSVSDIKSSKTICRISHISANTDLSELSYLKIFKALKSEAFEKYEKINTELLCSSADLFENKEKPFKNCSFFVTENDNVMECDYIWKKSKVMYFSSDYQDYYEASKNCDYKCFYGNDENFNLNEFIDSLKEND